MMYGIKFSVGNGVSVSLSEHGTIVIESECGFNPQPGIALMSYHTADALASLIKSIVHEHKIKELLESEVDEDGDLECTTSSST
jgi:hypothetical protein